MPHKIYAQGVKIIAEFIANNPLHLASSSTAAGHKRLGCLGGGARFIVTHRKTDGDTIKQEFATLEEAVAAYNAIDEDGAE